MLAVLNVHERNLKKNKVKIASTHSSSNALAAMIVLIELVHQHLK